MGPGDIKPGKSKGSASHMTKVIVATSEGLFCPASLGAHWWWSDGDDGDVECCSLQEKGIYTKIIYNIWQIDKHLYFFICLEGKIFFGHNFLFIIPK